MIQFVKRMVGCDMSTDNFKSWLDNELNLHGWSMNQLAQRGGFSHSSLSMALSGQTEISWRLAHLIAKSLDLPPVMVFREAGLLPKENAGLKAELITACTLLTHDNDMRLVIKIIETIYEQRKEERETAV